MELILGLACAVTYFAMVLCVVDFIRHIIAISDD